MDMMHGRATIIINGETIISEDGAEFTAGGISNDVHMIGNNALYSQKNGLSECKCKMPVTADTKLMDFQKAANLELQFVSDTGKRFVMRSAAQTATLKIGADGMVEPVFQSAPAIEQ